MVKPTHRPGCPFTLLPTIAPGPRRERNSTPTLRVKVSCSKVTHLSPGSRGSTRMASRVLMALTSATRLMRSAWRMPSRVRFTRLAICCAASTTRGSDSSVRSVCTQAKMPPPSSTASRKKVRQKRLSATFCSVMRCL